MQPNKYLTLSGAIGLWLGIASIHPALSQVNYDRVLSTVSITQSGNCPMVFVQLNRNVNFAAQLPTIAATDFEVRLQIVGTTQTPSPPLGPEAASVAPGNVAGLRSANFVPRLRGPSSLYLHFEKPVKLIRKNAPTADSLVFEVLDSAGGCRKGAADMDNAPPTADHGSLAEGKEALSNKAYMRAIVLFTKTMQSGSPAERQEAQEYLGLAHERAGQLAHARATYESYLKSYPRGAGAVRVRQRLDGVLATIEDKANRQFAENKAASPESGGNDVDIPLRNGGEVSSEGGTSSASVDASQTLRPGKSDLAPPGKTASSWTWTRSGSIGVFYYRNDGFNDLAVDGGLYQYHQVYQNDVAGSADLNIQGENDRYELTIRASGFQQNGFYYDDGQIDTNVSTAYVDLRDKQNGFSARVGRQTTTDLGIFGRFDGGRLNYEANENITLSAIVGSPVYYGSNDEVYADHRLFYAAGVDLSTTDDVWQASLYGIEQDVGDVLDRRALGAEIRYVVDGFNAYAGADYDIYFDEFNNAYAAASWVIDDKWTVSANVDYRHVPFLLTSNALIGQQYNDIESFVDLFGTNETVALALDRTASATTALASVTYQYNDNWQFSLDGSIADYSGTPASGGVDAVPDPGMEYYFSAMAYGSSVWYPTDTASAGLRFLQSETYRTYVLDAGYRFPWSEVLRLNPRIRLAYRDGRGVDYGQVMIMPSLAGVYEIGLHWNFEAEAAAKWEDNLEGTNQGSDAELLMSLGLRYEF